MAKPIDHIEQHELNPTLKVLAKAGGTTEHADWIRSGKNAERVIEFIDRERGVFGNNPYEMTVEEQIASFRRANDEGGWGIGEEVFARLAATAPAWPKGKYAYRSFRIRFGEGTEGVTETFEKHFKRLNSVRPDQLESGAGSLRLLNGDATHKPCIEWVKADLNRQRKCDNVKADRGVESLADELLVLAWMFPDAFRSIDDDGPLGMFVAGYELNVQSNFVRREDFGQAWRHVFTLESSQFPDHLVKMSVVEIQSSWSGRANFSVPTLRK